MKLLEQKIKSLLQEHLYLPSEHTYRKGDYDYVLKRYEDDITEALDDLNGTTTEKMEIDTLSISTEQFVLKIWSTLDFNRYRLKTLRAEFYDEVQAFKLDQFRVACKNQEKECLKKGTSSEYWTTKKNEEVFGVSESPGDLGLNGSASWKMRAFKSFLQDLMLFHQNKPVIVLSIYEKLMVQGNLITVEKLLLEYPTDFDKYFWQFLSRKINKELLIT